MLPSQPPPSGSSPRRRPLHDFALPRSWGSHRLLRCSNTPPPIPDHSDRFPRPNDDDDDDESFQEFRLRLLAHYDFSPDVPPTTPPPPPPPTTASAAAADKPRPWNLRKRRAACGAPQSDKCSSSTSSSKKQKTVGRERTVSLQLAPEEIEKDLKKMCPERSSSRKPRRRGQKARRIMESLNPGERLCRMMEEWHRIPQDRKRR